MCEWRENLEPFLNSPILHIGVGGGKSDSLETVIMDTDHVRCTSFQILPAISFVLFNMILCFQLSLMKINQTRVYQSFCHFYVFSKLSQLGLPKRKKKKRPNEKAAVKNISPYTLEMRVCMYILFLEVCLLNCSLLRDKGWFQ